jgi:hypothetical protein
MMIRPLERLSPIKRTTKPTRYGTRRSARSPALLTAVRSRRSGLAVHPRRVLHGPAAPDWRGELRVGRTRNSKDRRRIPTASRAACSTMPHWVTPVAQYVIIEPNPRRPPAVAAAPLCQITMLRRTPPPLLADGRSGAHATSCSPPPSPPLRRSSSPHCRRPSSPHCRRPSLPCGRRSPRHRRRRRRRPPPVSPPSSSPSSSPPPSSPASPPLVAASLPSSLALSHVARTPSHVARLVTCRSSHVARTPER